MKLLVSLALAGVLVAAPAVSGTITQKNAEKAAAIIDAAAEAHGGYKGLESIRTLIVENASTNHAVDQSRGAEPPWDLSESTGFDAIDLENDVYVTHSATNGGGFEGLNTTIINAENSYQLDYRAGTVANISEPDFATTSGPFVRVTPALLVRALKDRAGNAHYLGEEKLDGARYDVVAFSMTVGPAISLYFDQKRHLLRRSERILPGIGLVQYEFEDYEAVDGIPFNRTFNFYLEGDLNVERRLVSTKLNEPLDKVLLVDSDLDEIPEIQPDPLSRQEVADGVWLIGGSGTYAMFVDMGEYVFAAGGTAGIPERIASLREVAGDKPLRYGMLTHHHFDHVMGVSAYEQEGATVIAAAAHEKIARRAAENGDDLDVEAVADRLTLESGGRVIEVIDIGPTAHTEHLLVAYLPNEGILFEADHFALPRSGPTPPAVTSTRSFAEALARAELSVRRILSAHSPRPATMEDLEAALDATTFRASR